VEPSIVVLLTAILAFLAAARSHAEIRSGDVLGSHNWQKAEGLLPPGRRFSLWHGRSRPIAPGPIAAFPLRTVVA
jgi:hypothetical protein